MARYSQRDADKDLLEEIRERYQRAGDEVREIRQEGKTDIRYIAGDPWTAKDRQLRRDAGRPCLSLDELNQYVNQLINDIRQNKRAIKVTPIGFGANDQTAQFREGLIRQIEYRSNAQQAYTTMFENAVQRSYGWLRVKPRYVNDESPEQELIIEPVVNPDMVTPDPDWQRTDGSDLKYLFYGERWTVRDFQKQWPDAEKHSFDADDYIQAPQWIDDENHIVIAEYWTVEDDGKAREKLTLRTAQGPLEVFSDELDTEPSSEHILNRRPVRAKKVMQYLTNGVEILSRQQWCPARTLPDGRKLKAAQAIPFVSCYGKVLYVDDGGGPRRQILSMVRLAREPFMLHSYIATCIAEIIGGVPRNSWLGYEGQFRGHEADFQRAAHEPVPYLEVKPLTEATGQQILPPPQRQPWDPPIQNLLAALEMSRRSVQAAIAQNFLPSAAQAQSQKSGIALKKIDDSAQKGSFHFIDHYEEAQCRTGVILDELIPHYYDSPRDVTVREDSNATKVVPINKPMPDGTILRTDLGDHDITISTGPAFASEREAASDFADTIVTNPQIAQIIGPQKMQELLALAIKLKNVGPFGDEMADVISPKQQPGQMDPQQVQQAMGQAQQQIQQLHAMLQEATQKLQTDAIKQQGELQKTALVAQKDLQLQQMRDATSIAVAKIAASTKGGIVDREAQNEALATLQAQLHEATESAKDRIHDVNMQQLGHDQALAQGQQQAALQPSPAVEDQGNAEPS